VRDPALWQGALEGVTSALLGAGTGIMGAMPSPLTGAAGNVEFLLHARKGEQDEPSGNLSTLLASTVSEAAARLPRDAAG
jgi:23S rRNA (cytidine1920-2'-O)/16S rRNA (cytidine1409-2'-O)-methyltransferase